MSDYSQKSNYITITLKEWLEIKPKDVNKLTFQIAGKDGPSLRAEDWLVELTREEYEEYIKEYNMSIKMYECDNCGNGDMLVMQNGLCEHCQPDHDAVTNVTVDMVNSPNHYKQYDSIDGEVIDLIEEVERAYPLGLGYCIGNALKYILRAPFKGNMKQDLQKAIYYLERAVSKL